MDVAVIVIVLVALGFDFVNGFHDAANSIATVVSTRVLTPRQAVAWAAFFNFAAFLLFGDKVASTIAKDVVDQGTISIGGIAGAAVAKAGTGVLVGTGLRTIGIFIVLSPLIGLAFGLILTLLIYWV